VPDRGTIEGGVLSVIVQFVLPPFSLNRRMAESPCILRQGDLPKLDIQIDRGTEFTAWRTQWDSYCSLSGLAREEAQKQVKVLTLCLSRETLAIVHNLGLSEEQMKQPDAVIQAMQEYMDGHVNETVERRYFPRGPQRGCNLVRLACNPGVIFRNLCYL